MFDTNDQGLESAIMNGGVKVVQAEEGRKGEVFTLVSAILHGSGIRAHAENLDRNGASEQRCFKVFLPQKGHRIADVERLVQILRYSKLKISRYVEADAPQ